MPSHPLHQVELAMNAAASSSFQRQPGGLLELLGQLPSLEFPPYSPAPCPPVSVSPDTAWMQQIARNLSDGMSGFLGGMRYLLMDRDTKYADAFRRILRNTRVHESG